MALTHVTTVRNTLAEAIRTAVDTGGGTAILRIEDSTGPTTLMDFNLLDPAYGAPAAGTITLNGTPIGSTAVGSGTADRFLVFSKASSEVFRGTVTGTGGGGDLEIDNPNIVVGQTGSLDSHNYSASA